MDDIPDIVRGEGHVVPSNGIWERLAEQREYERVQQEKLNGMNLEFARAKAAEKGGLIAQSVLMTL